MEYGEWGSTDAGEDTELSVWLGDRESTVTSPSVRADRENKDRKKKNLIFYLDTVTLEWCLYVYF